MFKNYSESSMLYILPFNDSILKLPEDNLNSYSFFLKGNYLYYMGVHLKFSTLMFSSQFIDNLAYSLPSLKKVLTCGTSQEVYGQKAHNLSNIYVLHFFRLKISTHVFFFFDLKTNSNLYCRFSKSKNVVTTIEDLFFNANWCEREVSEMSGIFFFGKNDNRNLLMSYSDFFFPLKKYFPSVGLFELYYDIISDLIVKVNTNNMSQY